MLAKLQTFSLLGIEALPVEVEVDVSDASLPKTVLVGLPEAAMSELGLSARAHDKVLRVSRTIADLDGSPEITTPHLAETINYRMLDRNIWT